MITFMSWELRRKLMYALGTAIFLAAVTIFFLRDIVFPAPTCFDKKQNGYESGVDCGGVCSLRCSQEVNPLTVLFGKAVRSGENLYDLVAMVNNNNIDNASYELGYSFALYDKDGKSITTILGSTTAPLGGKFPIIVQNLPLQTTPTNVVVSLNDTSHYKVKENPASPTIKILSRRYEAGPIPRLYATIMNTKRLEINKLPVRALLFDQNDNVYAVGQTIIPVLQKEEVREIVFTWNEPLPFAPTRIGIYPIFNPFEAIGY